MNEARMPLDDIRIESVDVDIAIQGQYVNYSAEILRLSVLAIGAVGYLITTKPNLSKWALVCVAGSMGISAAIALFHRYIAADIVALQVRRLRLLKRNTGADYGKVRGVTSALEWRLRSVGRILLFSAGFLLVGAAFFVYWLALAVLR